MRRSFIVSVGVVTTVCIAVVLLAQDSSAPPPQMVIKADQMKWTAAPPGLPPGGVICVLDGDPSRAGLFTFRAKVPAGYAVRPHWHSCDENITVLSGKLFIGHGDQFDKTAGMAV